MTNERNGGYATISEDEAVAMMSENSATLVDVRTAREYADGHIPGAINIPCLLYTSGGVGSEAVMEILSSVAQQQYTAARGAWYAARQCERISV